MSDGPPHNDIQLQFHMVEELAPLKADSISLEQEPVVDVSQLEILEHGQSVLQVIKDSQLDKALTVAGINFPLIPIKIAICF